MCLADPVKVVVDSIGILLQQVSERVKAFEDDIEDRRMQVEAIDNGDGSEWSSDHEWDGSEWVNPEDLTDDYLNFDETLETAQQALCGAERLLCLCRAEKAHTDRLTSMVQDVVLWLIQ